MPNGWKRRSFKILSFLLPLIFFTPVVLAVDVTAPITTMTQTPSSPDGKNSWYVTPVEFQLDATDLESGVKEINYRIDGQGWQKVEFSSTLNLAPNPSFETAGATTTTIADWEASVIDGGANYTRDTGEYYTGFSTSSAKIESFVGPWHAINNKDSFAVATPFENMSASVWVKTNAVTGSAYFKMYSVSQDGSGMLSYIELAQSNAVTGTVGWTQLNVNFIVNDANSIGVYMDLGLDSDGMIWADAATISESTTNASTSFFISTDSTNHTLEYYSVDVAGNTEVYSCPATNCTSFKLDQTPPGGWYNSGAVRGVGGAEHEVFVFTNVKDLISGLSTLSDKYMYKVDTVSDFGYYEDLIHCNTPWHPNEWESLLTPPAADGTTDTTLVTQKTDFCNSNWKVCKSVRFYAEDMAGNTNTKDFCINGPWLKFRGEGIVRANENIDMISEPDEHNTDGLIEAGGTFIDFFSSTKNWPITQAVAPDEYTYDRYIAEAGSPTILTTDLVTTDGVYLFNGDFEIENSSTPNNYDTEIFNQVVFVDGNLRISNNVEVDEESAALFIVSGDVEIDKAVETVGIAIIADGNFSTAYNISEGEHTKTLTFNGVYGADLFNFGRTLQGTNNEKYPSDDFNYEPKYLLMMKDYFGKRSIIWKNVR